MAKINILFDNKNYNIDESAFSSASANLKNHLSTVMNGSGAVINIGGISYNVDSAKLSTAMNAFTTHLGTISGSGSKLVVNGVQYNINSAKLSDAITELHDVLGGLHSDGGSGDSGMNEYGFYFGVPYSATLDVDGGVYKLIYVFHEDGSVNFKLYIDGVLSEEESGGSVVYDQNKATFPDGMVIIFTENGTKFVDPNDITCTLETSYTSSLNEYGFYYDTKYSCYSDTSDESEIGFIFKQNQTADLYIGGVFAETTSVTYSDEHIDAQDIEMTFDVTSNGAEMRIYDPSEEIKIKIGDTKIVNDDYTYWFCNIPSNMSFSGSGWLVTVNDKTKSSYGEIRNDKPDGYPLHLYETFYNCTNLTTAPAIPSSVISMSGTFKNCINLEGYVQVGTNPTSVSTCFSGTVKPITITGSCSTETKAALAATANNGNVTY